MESYQPLTGIDIVTFEYVIILYIVHLCPVLLHRVMYSYYAVAKVSLLVVRKNVYDPRILKIAGARSRPCNRSYCEAGV